MLRLAADENFNGDVIRGLVRRYPDLDIVRVQDVGLSGVDDPTLLEWCAENGRILLTHDVQTMIGFAYARVERNEAMPGIVVAAQTLPIGQVIDNLSLLVECGYEGEREGKWSICPCANRGTALEDPFTRSQKIRHKWRRKQTFLRSLRQKRQRLS